MSILKILNIKESNHKEPFDVELPDGSKIVGVTEDEYNARIYCLIENFVETTSNYQIHWIDEGDRIPDKYSLIGISHRHGKLLFNTEKIQPLTKMKT